MIQTISSKVQRFKRGEKGGVLVFVGICLLPIMLMLGLAIDSSVGMEQKRKLQAAVNAAAQAGVANGNGVAATITSEAKKVFAANITNMSNITGPTITVNTANNTVTVSASINVTNIFMSLGGMSNSTYNASSTIPMASGNLAEVAIVYEVSARFLNNNFHQNICNALINFVNSLPNNVMVSITPIATEILLDPATTVSSSLFSNLSPTTNDESAYPGLFPLASSYAWTSGNYNLVANPFYTSGQYAVYPTDSLVLMSNPSPATCPGGYPSCSPLTWPTLCSTGTSSSQSTSGSQQTMCSGSGSGSGSQSQNTSCSQVYSYISNTAYPILPLTLNKTLAVNYLNGLKAFATAADGLFPSLISWGWRTIDPNWNNFWQTNTSLTSTLRSTGQYPKPYGGTQKSMIIIFNGTQYWNDYAPDISAYYSNKCGNAATVVNGLDHWWLTAYGMVPVPTDYMSLVDDITCENRWYNTMDNTLGLNLTATGNYNATVNSSTYATDILNAVGAKFFRICNNIKAQNINVYLMSNSNTGTLAPCCTSSSNAYTIGNSSTSISTALNAIQAQIVAKVN